MIVSWNPLKGFNHIHDTTDINNMQVFDEKRVNRQQRNTTVETRRSLFLFFVMKESEFSRWFIVVQGVAHKLAGYWKQLDLVSVYWYLIYALKGVQEHNVSVDY